MGKVSKNVLEKIKKENIKPIPKWHFMLKKSFIWNLFVLNILLGSVGFAIIIYLLVNNEALFDMSLAQDLWQWILLAVPVLWILLTLFFFFVAYYNFTKTEDAFRFSVGRKLLINIGITILLGFLLYSGGFSEKLNNLFADNLPFYSHTLDTRLKIWMRPEEGFLAGEILELNEKEFSISLLDLSGDEWSVVYKDAFVKGRVILQKGEVIKLIGESSSEGRFVASEIRPWQGNGRGMQER